jgi:hypothetical protein
VSEPSGSTCFRVGLAAFTLPSPFVVGWAITGLITSDSTASSKSDIGQGATLSSETGCGSGSIMGGGGAEKETVGARRWREVDAFADCRKEEVVGCEETWGWVITSGCARWLDRWELEDVEIVIAWSCSVLQESMAASCEDP